MAQYKHLPIYKGTYDLLLRIMIATKDFPREYKYTLGQKMRDEVLELIIFNAVIGAGSVVVKDVPPCAFVAGNPARIIRFMGFGDQDPQTPTLDS